MCHKSGPGQGGHTVRVCIVDGVVVRSICPAMAVTLRPDKNTGPEVLALDDVTQCAAVTTNDELMIVPPHRSVPLVEYIESST